MSLQLTSQTSQRNTTKVSNPFARSSGYWSDFQFVDCFDSFDKATLYLWFLANHFNLLVAVFNRCSCVPPRQYPRLLAKILTTDPQRSLPTPRWKMWSRSTPSIWILNPCSPVRVGTKFGFQGSSLKIVAVHGAVALTLEYAHSTLFVPFVHLHRKQTFRGST